MIELYYGWFSFWTTYFSLATLLPRNEAITRPIAQIFLSKVIKQLLVNCFISFTMVPFLWYLSPIVSFSTSWSSSIVKYLLAIFLADVWFYHVHRLLHHPYFYKWHVDHHAFIQPYALAALYCSVIEMMLLNQLSVAVPMRLLDFTTNELIVSNILLAINSLKGHSGLQLYKDYDERYRWLVDWGIDSEMHDAHHKRMTCNYGATYLLDWAYGTLVY